MTQRKQEQNEPIYLQNGQLVIDTLPQRVAAEISLQNGRLGKRKKSLEEDVLIAYGRLQASPGHPRRLSEYNAAKETLLKFNEMIAPLQKPRTLPELQTDLMELQSIEKNLSITDPTYAKLLNCIEFRTMQIDTAQAELAKRYEAGLQELDELRTQQAPAPSPWIGKLEGKTIQNPIADLHKVFDEKKHVVTEDSVVLLEKTLALLEENLRMPNTYVERVKTELAQQEKASKSASIPSATTKETLNTEEESTQKHRM